MYTLFVILIVIAALLMIGIVLIQESKGGGLASQFSGYNQIGGVRKTTDFIEKATWFLAGFMVVISKAGLWFFYGSGYTRKSSAGSSLQYPGHHPSFVVWRRTNSLWLKTF